MNKNKYIICFIASVLFIASCSDIDEELTSQTVSRTLIVYMAADNDLAADAFADLEEMKQGFSETGANLIVFIDPKDENPYLLEIHPKEETFIQSYSELNSADPNTLKAIIEAIINKYPAEEYGLILWSHGTSWMPAGNSLRSFGKDNGNEINIPDLAKALPIRFNFILMDACLMGAVEVAYELKDKTDYFIASSTETIYTGFPYDKIIPELLKPQINFKAVAQHYFEYYNAMRGAYRSATISVVDTIMYNNHTPQFILQYDINTYCGLSCYIPHPQRRDMNEYYQSLKWYEDSGWNYFFDNNFKVINLR
jgi:hypothetical protein